MTVSILDGCSDMCGWVAAATAAAAYGSYGVPIKACSNVDVDPLVMQSYKTFVFFLTCWLVVLLGEEIRFTPWGIVSGLLWIPGGTSGVPAIRMAGMAVAGGTWTPVIVMMNFVWGILIFQESVKSFWGTTGSFMLLIVGMIGTSIYSAPSTEEDDSLDLKSNVSLSPTRAGYCVSPDPEGKVFDIEAKALISPPPSSLTLGRKFSLRKRASDIEETEVYETESSSDAEDSYTPQKDSYSKVIKQGRFTFFGGRLSLTRRQCGVLCAVINGVLCGTCLIPMHYAHLEGYSAAAFLVSFACGSFVVNVATWVAIFLFRLQQKRGSVLEAFAALPSWHIKELWFAGTISGVLFSIGMFGSILAVTYLGQGVGNSFVENQIIVGGLWGIFYYKEIAGRAVITKWFLSASITVLAILWLSYEHESERTHPTVKAR